MGEKRKDNKGRVLRLGEQQRKDGRYIYTYKKPDGSSGYLYSWKLEKTDRIPAGKRVDLSLREKIKELEEKQKDGLDYVKGQITVLELVERYIVQKTGVRPSTRNGYKTVVNHLKKHEFGKRIISDIKTSDAKMYLIGLQDKGKSYSAIHTIRGVLRPAFQTAVEDDILKKNPFEFELAKVLINDSVRREAITKKQQKDFLKFIKNDDHFSKYYDGMFILFETGLRISEFCGLTLKDIDLNERTINIDHQLMVVGGKGKYIEKTKTNAGTRVLPMSDEVYDAFKRVISTRAKPKIEEMIDGYSGFLFLDERHKPMLSYQWEKKFKYAVEKYNKTYVKKMPKITPHVCRHTYCTNMAKSGISVKTLQYLMGHSDIGVTLNVYTHIKYDDAKFEIEKMNRQKALEELERLSMEEAKNELKRLKSV